MSSSNVRSQNLYVFIKHKKRKVFSSFRIKKNANPREQNNQTSRGLDELELRRITENILISLKEVQGVEKNSLW